MTKHRPRAARAPAARGFTLIELVVTIALLGILVMLSVPSFTSWIRNSQIRTVAEALQTGVRTAQAESVRRNRQVVLFFTDGEPSAGVSGSTKCSSATPALGGKRWAVQTLPGPWGEETSGCTNAEYLTGGKLSDIASSVTITNDKLAKAICFRSDGRLATTASGSSGTGVNAACTAAATTFTVTTAGADRPLKLIVQLGGQLRMCDPNRPTLSANSPDGCP